MAGRPRPVDSSVQIASLRPVDVPEIHRAYDHLGEEGKRFFHPGFLGSEPLSLRGIAGRLLLGGSARPLGRRILAASRVSPFLIGAVARGASGVVGFSFVLVRPRVGIRPGTFGVFVLPRYEGEGVGSRLTDFVLRAARDLGLQEAELTVQTENERARRLYERHGFAIVETVRRGDVYRGNAYDHHRMRLKLSDLPEH